MKRFHGISRDIFESDDGDYVLYEDHVLELMAQDKLLAERGDALAACDKRIAELEQALTNAEAGLYARNAALEGAEARTAELQEEFDTWIHTNGIDVMQRRIAELERAAEQEKQRAQWVQSPDKDARIAELEKQAAIDKTLLALADARINRELRDDFAGRAMQGALSSGSFSMLGHPERAKFAYTQADEMLKAKGGA